MADRAILTPPAYHGRDHRPRGWNSPDDPGAADPMDWLVIPRIIAGRIEGGTTTILGGTGGFTVDSATVTGGGYEYAILFDPELPAVPIVLAGHGGTGFVFSNTSVGVSVLATTGFLADSDDNDDWQFIAVVP